jgi:hypothetical protein
MKARGLFSKPPPEGQGAQLRFLCTCGRRPIELKALRCCRLCYYRQYDSLRWFGGLRDLILKRVIGSHVAHVERRAVSWSTIATSATRNLFLLRCASVATCGGIIRDVSASWYRKLCSNYGASCIRVRRCSCNCPSQQKRLRLMVAKRRSGRRGQNETRKGQRRSLNRRRQIYTWDLVKFFDQSFAPLRSAVSKLSVNQLLNPGWHARALRGGYGGKRERTVEFRCD